MFQTELQRYMFGSEICSEICRVDWLGSSTEIDIVVICLSIALRCCIAFDVIAVDVIVIRLLVVIVSITG